MIFDVMTLFPEMIENACNFSILKRALENNIIKVNTINPRDFTLDKHKKVDDTPYGGGAGMVLMPQPYVDAYDSIDKCENSVTIMLSSGIDCPHEQEGIALQQGTESNASCIIY